VLVAAMVVSEINERLSPNIAPPIIDAINNAGEIPVAKATLIPIGAKTVIVPQDVPIDVETMCIDVLCFTGHKSLFGIQGTGGVYISDTVQDKISPIIWGGTGTDSFLSKQPTDMPEAYEAGTVNVHGISALGAGADYIMSFADGEILRHEQKLKKKIIDELSLNEKIVLYGGRTDESVGIVSFTVKGYDSQKVADVLAEKGICVRGGFHCAPLAHKTLGTYNTGTVRMSFGIMNTEDEAIKVCKVINNL
jgi:selenocysteine lyase/cysteine desulfurase